MINIVKAIKSAFSDPKGSCTFSYDGEWYTIHSNMNADEVFEILDNEIPVDSEFARELFESSMEKLIEQNQDAEAREPHYQSLTEELEYAFSLYKMAKK
jgi:hypothetical protein